LWIDSVWQWIAETVFVRFEFDLPAEELRQRSASGRVIFAITNGGLIDWLILSSWCRSQGLGPILVANRKRILILAKPKYFFQILFRRRRYADLYLSDQPGPRLLFVSGRERKQPFALTPSEKILCEVFSGGSANGTIGQYHWLPLYILWRKHTRGASRNPSEYLFGLSSNPNLIGKLWYLARRRIDSTVRGLGFFTMTGKDIGEKMEAFEETDAMRAAKSARRRILVVVNQEMRVVLGPRYHSPQAAKETVLRDPEVQNVIAELERTEGIPRRKLMSRAYKDLTEIVADYKFRLIEVMYVVLTWLFSRVFDGLVVRDDECQRVRELMKNKPVVFVPCHRSHLDYLVIPYVLFLHDMITPHIAAGVNLSFWPVGRLLRMGGAFFIRRSFRGDKLYSVVLRKYVEYILKNRFNIKFFIEGTRSRSGKMLAPAYGMLKMTLQTYENKVCDDIAFVPVSLCYDEVPEQGSYQRELIGGQKVKESASQLFKSRKIIRNRFGKVYVRMAPPLFARDIFQASGDMDSKLLLQKTAFQICKTINDYTPITPKSLVSTILLTHRVGALPLDDLLRLSLMLTHYVKYVGMDLSVPGEEDFRRAIEQTVRRLQKSGIVSVTEAIPRSFACDYKKRILLNYYKNNAIHCFVGPAITAVALLSSLKGERPASAEAFETRYRQTALRLRGILKFEFFFSPTQSFAEELRRDVGFFLGETKAGAWTPDAAVDALQGRLEHWNDISIYLRLLGDLLESYLTVATFVVDSGERGWEKKALLQRLVKYAETKQLQGGIYFPESISVQNFSNALLLLENQKYLAQRKEGEKTFLDRQPAGGGLETLVQQLREYLDLVQENPETVAHPEKQVLLT
jgi:glycerol-3-phosphate O-acyltransferase